MGRGTEAEEALKEISIPLDRYLRQNTLRAISIDPRAQRSAKTSFRFGLMDIINCYDQLKLNDYSHRVENRDDPLVWEYHFRFSYKGFDIYTHCHVDGDNQLNIMSFKDR